MSGIENVIRKSIPWYTLYLNALPFSNIYFLRCFFRQNCKQNIYLFIFIFNFSITKYLNAVTMEIEKFYFHKHGSRCIKFVTKCRGKGMLPAFPGNNEWCSPSSHQSPQLLQLSPPLLHGKHWGKYWMKKNRKYSML